MRENELLKSRNAELTAHVAGLQEQQRAATEQLSAIAGERKLGADDTESSTFTGYTHLHESCYGRARTRTLTHPLTRTHTAHPPPLPAQESSHAGDAALEKLRQASKIEVKRLRAEITGAAQQAAGAQMDEAGGRAGAGWTTGHRTAFHPVRPSPKQDSESARLPQQQRRPSCTRHGRCV